MKSNVIAGCVLALSFWLSTSSGAAAEIMHLVPERELIAFETKLQLQEKTISSCKKDLILLQEQLKSSQALSVKLKEQLSDSKKISQQQSALIQNANQSLEEYAREVKRKERIIKKQRTFAWCVAGVVLIYAIK